MFLSGSVRFTGESDMPQVFQTTAHLHEKRIAFIAWQKFQRLTRGMATNVFATMHRFTFRFNRDFPIQCSRGEVLGCSCCLWKFNEVTMGLTGAIIEKIKCNGPAGRNNDAFRKREIRSCLKMFKVWMFKAWEDWSTVCNSDIFQMLSWCSSLNNAVVYGVMVSSLFVI